MQNLTAEQTLVASWAASENKHMIVTAVAGAGKSTVLKAAIDRDSNTLVLSFNKKVQKAFQDYIEIEGLQTIHAQTFSSFSSKLLHLNGINTSAFHSSLHRTDKAAKAAFQGRATYAEQRVFGDSVSFLLSTGAYLFNDGNAAVDTEVTRRYGRIKLPDSLEPSRGIRLKTIIRDVKAYFEILNDEISTSIFTNLGIEHVEYVAAKLKNKLSYPKTDFLMVDESQDMNLCQIELIKAFCSKVPDMRVLTVGDPFQCIYGFRGAFLRAIETLADYLIQQDATSIHRELSLNFRCPPLIVEEARKYGPPNMKSGITNGNCAITRKVFTYEDIAGQAVRGDFLLFTDNVSLARTVAALLIAGKHVSAFDPEIKEQLQAFYNKKIKDKQISLNDLIPTVRTKKDKKIKQARESASSASARPFNLKAAVMEIIESLLKEMNIGNLPNDLQQFINDTFLTQEPQAQPTAIWCTTVFIAKGSESGRVYFNQDDNFKKTVAEALQTKAAGQPLDDEHQSKLNAMYVGITRACGSDAKLIYFDIPQNKNNNNNNNNH